MLEPSSAGRRRQAARVIMRRIHLWLGLSVGLLFALAGLTGSVLVFYPELDTLLHQELRQVQPGARPASWEAVYQRLRQAHPDRSGAWRIEVRPDGGAIPVRYYKPRETRDRDFAPLMLWVDPVSLRTLRSDFWGDYAVTWTYDLHYRLLLGRPGALIMGIAGMAMLVLLASGLWAWWPRPGALRRSLRFKPDAAPIRRLYDIHKLAGLWSLVLLLVVTVTGVMLDLPDQVRPIIAQASPLFTSPSLVSRPGPGGALPLDGLVQLAQARFPGAQLAWIETPATPAGTVRINLAQAGEPSRRFPRTNVWLDPYSGQIMAVRDAQRDSAGDAVLTWLHPLHSGEAFGLTGRILVFLSGIASAVLFVTGVLRWAQRRTSARPVTSAKM